MAKTCSINSVHKKHFIIWVSFLQYATDLHERHTAKGISRFYQKFYPSSCEPCWKGNRNSLKCSCGVVYNKRSTGDQYMPVLFWQQPTCSSFCTAIWLTLSPGSFMSIKDKRTYVFELPHSFSIPSESPDSSLALLLPYMSIHTCLSILPSDQSLITTMPIYILLVHSFFWSLLSSVPIQV